MIEEFSVDCRVCRGQYFQSNVPGDRCENCETCVECGKTMPNTFDQAYDSLCSPQCEDALGERVERLINYVAPVRRKQISSSKRLALFERDGWTCYLCDFPVNRDASWPDADFPVLDHVVPYAKGGSDTPDNLKTAHALCNGQKKDADLAAYLSRALGVPNFAR